MEYWSDRDLLGARARTMRLHEAYELGSEVKAECITGVNLPMLLEAASGTSYMNLEELKNACLTSGPEGIVNLKDKIQI